MISVLIGDANDGDLFTVNQSWWRSRTIQEPKIIWLDPLETDQAGNEFETDFDNSLSSAVAQ